MNKQQLASLIWDYCNGLRGSISTVEYKDFILGFIFYRFLSEKETTYLKSQEWTDDDIKKYLKATDSDTVNQCKDNLGYFIAYDDLFSTWKEKGTYDIADISEAIRRFDQNINSNHLNIYDKIFKSLTDKLPKLGAGNEAKSHLRKIINIVLQIPMNEKRGYDVLGFIYEYLLANFASNAGKKDGEFYTPHEISLLMSEIAANHLKDRDTINIFDPTSGSGSLLINIGQCIQKYMSSPDNIIYYAQEKIEDTYNLTRMNLVMRGINPNNISVRCADTLEKDWPYIDENNVYRYLPVDCVVSNPPYSQKWESDKYENDPRYRNYGTAPAGKADYAFLLHELYHLKDDGIMCIVLPHGVLFRGGTEQNIRKNLVENNNIETIIGLPANIFYGTGIPTIIMVLKKHRTKNDILFIDASKEFYKDGNKNKLSGHNIKKIVDTIIERKEHVEYFSRLVKKEEIIENDYNLNIPRYISSTKPTTPYDINATVFGNIPNYEIEEFNKYWNVFPKLKNELYKKTNKHISQLKNADIREVIIKNNDVINFIDTYNKTFQKLEKDLYKAFLVDELKNVQQIKSEISKKIFNYCKGIELIDKYLVYKSFDDLWQNISIDLETIINANSFGICKEVEAIEEYSKKEKEIVKKGQQGKVIPFELIQQILFQDDFEKLESLNNQLNSAIGEFDSYWEEMDEELKTELKKDNEDEVNTDKLKTKNNEILATLSNETTKILSKYLELSKKQEKTEFIEKHKNVFDNIKKSENGNITATNIKDAIKEIKNTIEIDENDDDFKIRKLYLLNEKIKSVKKQRNKIKNDLDNKAQIKLKELSIDEIKALLKEKWINPIMHNVYLVPVNLIDEFIANLENITKKYSNPLTQVNKDIQKSENELLQLIEEINGDEFDMAGLEELKNILGDKK